MNNKNNNEENINDKDEPLIHHLEALRSTLLNSLKAILLLSPFGFYFAPAFIKFIINNSMPNGMTKLHYFSPMEVFIIEIKTGIILAFVFAFPFIVNEMRKFITPALYEHEKKFVGGIIISSSLLFLAGSAVCIFMILPLIMNFSASFATSSLEATLGLENFIGLAGSLIIAFGLMFQFPLIVLMSVKMGLVSVKTLRNARPYVIVAILIFAALLTPPDIVSQLMLGIPTWL